MLDDNGTANCQARPSPYGEEHRTDGELPADSRFTGQTNEASLGLSHMGARFYDASLTATSSGPVRSPSPSGSSTSRVRSDLNLDDLKLLGGVREIRSYNYFNGQRIAMRQAGAGSQ